MRARLCIFLVTLALPSCGSKDTDEGEGEARCLEIEAMEPCSGASPIGSINGVPIQEEGVRVQLCGSWTECLVPCAAEGEGARRECSTGYDLQRCVTPIEGLGPVWGVCGGDECDPDCDVCCGSCDIDTWGTARFTEPESWEGCDTPLVVALDGAEPDFLTPTSASPFDIAGAGACDHPAWPSPATPWLARDLDRSGAIEGGHELFGSGTRLAGGRRARHGFEALAAIDSDGDGVLTPRDAAWSELALWTDVDGDRRSSGWELLPIDAFGVEAIALAFRPAARCDRWGNCSRERAPLTFRSRGALVRGEVIDVHLTCD